MNIFSSFPPIFPRRNEGIFSLILKENIDVYICNLGFLIKKQISIIVRDDDGRRVFRNLDESAIIRDHIFN